MSEVRIIYGDGTFLSKLDHVQKNISKVFAVVGPFDSHQDKPDLQDALMQACLAHEQAAVLLKRLDK